REGLHRRATRQLRLGPARLDLVPPTRTGADPGHRGQRMHHGAQLLGQVEVVLDQRVLGAVPAAGHALAAVDAAGPLRSDAAEVGVLDLLAAELPGATEEDTDR